MSDDWRPRLDPAAGPLYLAIAEAIASDLTAGRLAPGARLPPQRVLAQGLGVDFTTVSRAYAEAARRGLVEGRVGQGTYVRVPGAAASAGGPVDLSMNLPPHFEDRELTGRMWREIAELQATGLDLLLRYQEAGGAAADRQAGALWLQDRLPGLDPERITVCPGAQSALLAVIGALAAPGETICAEALTYPGLKALAAQLRLNVIGLAMDGEGIVPDAFEAACRDHPVKALVCTPTLQNPTTATMSLARRRALVDIARAHAVPIVEDDAYGLLPETSPPPIAALAPDLTFHIAGLAKPVSPALRIAYLAAPDSRSGAKVRAAIRATTAMASPLTAAIATRWITGGTAQAVRDAIRQEARARQVLAARLLPAGSFAAHPDGFHLWLNLPPGWTRGEFALQLRATGIGVVVSDAFAIGPNPPEAVRIGLGGPAPRRQIDKALAAVADILDGAPVMTSAAV
ncbi:PLP-dependent aminotransferase family protein [Phenylobacterium sp.]|uniref:aminotransferase-like domain-containing protein n=1 Tax=Phenylobacterium sp. TaxID=1871053 RepID=UPI003BA87D58